MISFIGNNQVVSELNSIISSGNIGHAYMFFGPEGVGKFLLAKEFSKEIGASLDVSIIEPENGLIKVDVIRALSENIMLKPTISERRAFIINNADTMNESAQNALLKILEEPPAYATIILVTSNKEKILVTIKSRCTIFNFKKLTDEELQRVFPEENITKEMLDFSNGSAGKYLKLKNSNYAESIALLEGIIDGNDLLEQNRAIVSLKKNKTIKEDIDDILDLLIIKIGNNLLKDSQKRIKQIELIEEVRSNIKRNINFEDSLDYLAIRLWEINNKK
ncbi:MAG: AAA family ATPase [Clostridia bacterium]|nr:AAA family ATPase [Clostridia bacterium]